jgi:4-amino-4-deoxy-L-arabinose transferase-like glycosyltransferase
VALFSCLFGQDDRQLQGPDEAREAGITLAMARTGDYVVPRLNGRPFLEKPPLFHAAGAVVLKATGSRSPFAVRLPAALFSVATLGAVYLLGRRLGGARIGALAVLALATTAGFHAAAHRAVTDNAVPPFVAVAFLGVALLLDGGPRGTAFALLGAGSGFAFLAKGAVGPALVVAGGGAALAWAGRLRLLLDRRALLGLGLALLPAAAWLGALAAAEGAGALRTVLVDNNWGRATSAAADHANPPWYYATRAPALLLPWLPLAVLGAVRAFRERGPWRVPLAWLGGGLLLLSLASAKRPVYLLPLLPAAALLAAKGFAALFLESPAPRGAGAWRALVGAAAVLGVAAGSAWDGLARPGDLPWAASGILLAAAGAWGIRRALAAGRPRDAAAVALSLAAVALALGFRARGPAEDAERGYDGLAGEVAAAAVGRHLVLVRPPEALEGILTFRLDRDVATVPSPAALAEAARSAPREVLFVGNAASEALGEALAEARPAGRWRVGRNDLVAAILPAHGGP